MSIDVKVVRRAYWEQARNGPLRYPRNSTRRTHLKYRKSLKAPLRSTTVSFQETTGNPVVRSSTPGRP
eukprot:5759368-Pyramimonas_sp.AAC.1